MSDYPSEEELKTIEEWPIKSSADAVALARYCQAIWWNPEWFRIRGKKTVFVNFSTAGWSGNESIVASLNKNFMFGMLGWVESRRGGHYKYHFDLL